ncbi:hypothetical protein PV516_19325 [Streptomyces scabiei]|uniref:hypothetical protein n=1 Tax=Streptomyces scabiei TaxID=1930 RepID=UPI0029A469F0|nr:hypothetical protein [Streptomyces scabiei]MDX3165941.1 hypothetical protein [Streptomyces scabiei]
MTSQVRRITDYLVPLLLAVGGLIVGRVALGLATQYGANLYWQAGTAVVAYTLTVALLGRIGNDDPYEAVVGATRALAHVIHAALAGALELLCLAVQLLAFIGGHLAALVPAPATT